MQRPLCAVCRRDHLAAPFRPVGVEELSTRPRPASLQPWETLARQMLRRLTVVVIVVPEIKIGHDGTGAENVRIGFARILKQVLICRDVQRYVRALCDVRQLQRLVQHLGAGFVHIGGGGATATERCKPLCSGMRGVDCAPMLGIRVEHSPQPREELSPLEFKAQWAGKKVRNSRRD